MKLARTKNALNNAKWGILNKCIFLLFPFIIRAILIRTLGIEYLGLSSLFTSVLSILNLAELGIGNAIVFSMYKPIAENDEETICALMNLYRKLYRYISGIVLTVGLILIPFLPKLIHGEVPPDINLYVLYAIYLSNAVISYWLFAYRSSILYAHQRNDVVSKVQLLTHLLLYIFQIIALLLTKNYYTYIILTPICGVVTNILNALFSKKIYPQYYCKGMINEEKRNDIVKRIKGMLILKISYASRNAFDSIVISSMLGLTAVAIYNNYYYLSTAVSGFLLVIMTSISAGIGNSLETESTTKNKSDLNKITFAYMTLAGFCFCCFLSLYQPFISLWVGEKLLFADQTMVIIALYFLIDKSENVIGQYYDAAGLWWYGKWKGILETIVNLSLNIILCKFWGITGIVFATMATIIVISIPLSYHYLYKYSFNQGCIQELLSHYFRLLCFGMMGIAPYFVTRMIPFGNSTFERILLLLIRLIIGVVLGAVVYLFMFSQTSIYRQTKEWLLSKLIVHRNHS